MKYKVGDKVRIKSIDWYNENKNNSGEITFESNPLWRFVATQSEYCGQIATITSVSNIAYRLENIPCNWTDEMIEGLAEEGNNISNIDKLNKISTPAEENWFEIEKKWEAEDLDEEGNNDYYIFTNDDIINLLKKLNKRESEFVKAMMIELEKHKGSVYCRQGVDMDFIYWYDTGR